MAAAGVSARHGRRDRILHFSDEPHQLEDGNTNACRRTMTREPAEYIALALRLRVTTKGCAI